MKVSILGCGWLGLPLGERLVEKGHSVKGSTTTTSKLQHLESIGITPHLINIEAINQNIIPFLDSEILIVAITSKSIKAFEQVIKYIDKSPIKYVVFISSTSVYKSENSEVIESSPTINSALAIIEKLFSSNTGFKTTILRFGGLFGKNRHPGNFFKSGKVIPNPDGFVNMIHQVDCIGIIDQLITSDIWNESFNACAPHHPTRKKFYSIAAKTMESEIPKFSKETPSNYKIVNTDKLQQAISYNFIYNNLLKAMNN